MVDKTIKVSVLEGDFALLSSLGFPLPLCIQLQLSCLKMDEALWTAKFTPGGFSVNLFWPAPAPEKNDVQPKKRRKRKRRRAKASSQVAMSKTNHTESSLSAKPSRDSQSETTGPKRHAQHNSDENPVLDLASCNDINYEVRNGVHGVSYCQGASKEAGWTPVVGKKRKRKNAPIPNFVRRRFPPNHSIHQRNATSESDTDSGSERDLNTIIPPETVNVHYSEVDGIPGLSVWTRSTRSWTPVAARTRARLKQ